MVAYNDSLQSMEIDSTTSEDQLCTCYITLQIKIDPKNGSITINTNNSSSPTAKTSVVKNEK